ncbi:type II toxin-antitoxin system RelE/ParE family toxin [Methanosarcinales archaeon]|nr:MAG: type II toxin-antitoxin system RelE/ParE family toxin [Methanosarcinales archaeon]
MPVIFKTPAAEEDLINLWRYIAQDNPAAADRVHQSAKKTFEAIEDMPGIGTAYRSKRTKLHGLRFSPLTQYPN